ncbi:MAG TPA: FtsX-like permease family protein [Ktedonobacteraceae bacterium]|nr:FtsX-like permease family protein [Ktedonobacteraceae bacterium]
MITTIFAGIDPNTLALSLAILTGGMFLILLSLGVSNPILLRMGLRNMVRRPSQTLLLLCGLLLSTVVTTASFGLSDSFTNSALTYRLAAMGNVDESVSGTFTQNQVDSALVRIQQLPEVQAASAIIFYAQGPTLTSLRTNLSIHNMDMYAVPPDFDRVYGPMTNTQGQPVHFAELHTNEVFLSATAAQNFDVRPGDRVRIDLGPETITSTVQALLSNNLGVTSGEAIQAGDFPEVILPLATVQQVFQQATHQASPPDIICIKNNGQGGMDDIGPDGSRSQAVVHFLQQIFPGASASLNVPHALGTTEFDTTRIHPLKPDVVEEQQTLQFSKTVVLTSIGLQFSWLPPIFTYMLMGTGMLLLVLLIILLAAERRAELGMSRAIGLQRHHLIQLLLFEGSCYSIIAGIAGILTGIGATALELTILGHLPQLAPGEFGSNAVPVPVIAMPLHVWLSWQSMLSAWCLSVLITMGTLLVTAVWISRTNIVTAIRNLDNPPSVRTSLLNSWRSLWFASANADNVLNTETAARRFSRRLSAIWKVCMGLWLQGTLCLLAGGTLLVLNTIQNDTSGEMQHLALILFIAGVGLAIRWTGTFSKPLQSLARRVGSSFIGLGWLIAGILWENVFLSLFQPVVTYAGTPSALAILQILQSMLLLIVGSVIVVITNADLLVILLTALLRRTRGLAPISRTSLAYPLTFRFRTGVAMTLLSLVTFLILLLVTINLGSIQEAQAATNSGGFQLEATVFGSQLSRYSDLSSQLDALKTHRVLSRDFTAVGLLRLMYDLPQSGQPQPIRLDISGHTSYPLNSPPLVADDSFLLNTAMPMYARAQGFSSDQQVWDEIRDHPGYAVIQYDAHVVGLPSSSGFAPFSIDIPDSSDHSAHYHRLTVIGLIPASASWRVLVSLRTAAGIVNPPYIPFINTYLFHLQEGISEAQAASDLNALLDGSQRGINVQSLDHASQNGITAVFTFFLIGDLTLGLLFGILAIGVIASRSVVERRQQIGMLRALGFSRTLVRRSFLLEFSFVILLSLLIGTTLALWLAYQVAHATYQNFPLPLWTIVLILAGSFLVALISTSLPANRAARLHPAEALRYE